MTAGLFISLDGLDGAGKSTQCRLLANWLKDKDHQVVLCRDPGGTPAGDAIRELLLDRKAEMSVWCEAFLYMASRAELVERVIRPALSRGDMVICDRFVMANVVYQGYGGGLPVDKLWELGLASAGGLSPDVTIVLDLPHQVGAGRRQSPADRMESRGLDFFEKVRAGFLTEARRSPDKIKIIDANQPIEIIQQQIQQEVLRVLGSHSRS